MQAASGQLQDHQGIRTGVDAIGSFPIPRRQDNTAPRDCAPHVSPTPSSQGVSTSRKAAGLRIESHVPFGSLNIASDKAVLTFSLQEETT
jgi:hypothetical protein